MALASTANVRDGQSATENFAYDWLDRLTGVSGAFTRTYGYDGLDRVTTFPNAGTIAYATSTKPYQVTSDATGTYTYDANGNATVADCRTMTWNAENQLEKTTNSGTCGTQVVSNEYDGDGNRVLRGDSSGLTHYVNRWYQENITTSTPTVTYWQSGEQVATSTTVPAVMTPDDTLLQPPAQSLAKNGWAVDMSGDTLVVGAPLEDVSSSENGAAHVYVRVGGKWVYQQKLTASDGASGDRFGHAVSIDGDTLIISANDDDISPQFAGSAYVFTRSAGVWTQQQKIVASDPVAYDHFGEDVAIQGTTIVVGARGVDDLGPVSGAAYVFEYSGGTWSQTQKLLASDGYTNHQFGTSVVVDGTRLVVSAVRAGGHGAAYVFEKSGGTWSQTAQLVASDKAYNDWFGRGMALDGDTLAVGSDKGTGAVYIFDYSAGSWSETVKLTAPAGSGVLFGGGPGVDLGPGTLLVGDSGAKKVHLYELDSQGTWAFVATLESSDPANAGQFGISAALNAGFIAIGAPDFVNSGVTMGAVETYGVPLTDAEPITFLQVDHLGSPAVATDATGALLWERREYPYGDMRIDTGAAGAERLFTGQVEDADASLYYFNARYLETGIGRFISPDSIVPNPSDPRDHNRYSYVRNNPLKYTDPSGRAVCSYVGEFSDCDSIEDGSNYGAGITTVYAKKRIEVYDKILEKYDEGIAEGNGAIVSKINAGAWAENIEALVYEAQSSARSDWEAKVEIAFGSGGSLITDDYADAGDRQPSTPNLIEGTAWIVVGSGIATLGVVEMIVGGVGVPVTFGGSGLLVATGIATTYFGIGTINHGVCRMKGNCLDLPYIP